MTQEVPQSVEIQKLLSSMRIDEWSREEAFQSKWWILLALLIILVLTWCLLLDKSKLRNICLYTALVIIFVLGIDEYGDELILWRYPVDIIPIFRPLTSINLLLLPMAYTLAFQRYESTKSFLAAVLILTAIVCFVIEPALSWAGYYQLINWKYYYSYPPYVMVSLLVKKITDKILAITDRNRQQSQSATAK